MPQVSVITAAYNHVHFIRQSIESVQNQTFRDFEHIVIDDGSSDGTADVLKSFGNRITYIRQDNRGTHATLNRAIRESSGAFIALLDSDDAWLPDKLERQMKIFEQFPETGLVYSQAYRIDYQGNFKDTGEPFGKPTIADRATFEGLWRDNPIPTPTAIFRRACVEQVGGFNESLKALSDWELWIRISAKWPVVFIPEPLALYRVHATNSWDELFNSGRVYRERLRILGTTVAELSENRQLIAAAFLKMMFRTSYALWYRHDYLQALKYFAFAVRLNPMLLKDGIMAAIRSDLRGMHKKRMARSTTRLLMGERGTDVLRSVGRKFTQILVRPRVSGRRKSQ